MRRIFTMQANSMEGIGQSGENTTKKSQEEVKSAQEMRTDIDILKEGLQNMPSGLDDDIVAAVQAAEQAGREQATRDITEVQNQINQDMAIAETIKSQVDAKISENKAAQASLESLKTNRYGGGIDQATNAIETNNALGENIKSNIDAEYQSIKNDMEAAINGI